MGSCTYENRIAVPVNADRRPGDDEGVADDPRGRDGELARIERRLVTSADRVGRTVAREVEDIVVPAWRRATRAEQRWPASLAVLCVIFLQFQLPEHLSLSQRWILPAVQAVLLVVLTAANPRRLDRTSMVLRGLGLSLLTVASLANAWSVVRLVSGLVAGTVADNAATLLSTGGNIWLTNVIIFGLWYWELDRGGPADRASGLDPYPDLLFPQMATPDVAPPDWEPRFADYLYVAFTNATAFSPTDTLPLSRWAKAGMMLQSAVSLVTAALVVARAVNILR
jgi:hypothetical protein